jgi:hypothetical protein
LLRIRSRISRHFALNSLALTVRRRASVYPIGHLRWPKNKRVCSSFKMRSARCVTIPSPSGQVNHRAAAR